jgi:hypothetical protein
VHSKIGPLADIRRLKLALHLLNHTLCLTERLFHSAPLPTINDSLIDDRKQGKKGEGSANNERNEYRRSVDPEVGEKDQSRKAHDSSATNDANIRKRDLRVLVGLWLIYLVSSALLYCSLGGLMAGIIVTRKVITDAGIP